MPRWPLRPRSRRASSQATAIVRLGVETTPFTQSKLKVDRLASDGMAILISSSQTPCGVESFARRLALTAGPRKLAFSTGGVSSDPFMAGAVATDTIPADTGLLAMARAIAKHRTLVVNFPVVAWKRRLWQPLVAVAVAKAARLKIVVVLHEWSDLDWKRRLSYAPVLLLADAVVFSCREVQAQFAASQASLWTTRRRDIVTIPPNLTPPAFLSDSDAGRALQRERDRGSLILGHFGSIYPMKQSMVLLDVAADLERRGLRPFVVFAGSFIKGSDRIEDDFAARVRSLGLTDRVLVTGFIPSEDVLFAVFEKVDVFVYLFADGMTQRRGSVYAALTSGKPVVVNAAHDPDALAGHTDFQLALRSGHLRLVRQNADVAEIATAAIAACTDAIEPVALDGSQAWTAACSTVAATAARCTRPIREQAR